MPSHESMMCHRSVRPKSVLARVFWGSQAMASIAGDVEGHSMLLGPSVLEQCTSIMGLG